MWINETRSDPPAHPTHSLPKHANMRRLSQSALSSNLHSLSRSAYVVSSQYKIIGERPLRPDLIDKVTGKARYAADYTLPNMLHGAVVRSDVAHARINSIDT